MSSPTPAELEKILAGAGGRVALLGQKQQPPAAPKKTPSGGKRTCMNCFYNPSGAHCQLLPPDMIAIHHPNGVQITAVVRPAQADYACGQHRWDDDPPLREDGSVWLWETKTVAANS